jgi:hypothetical protein
LKNWTWLRRRRRTFAAVGPNGPHQIVAELKREEDYGKLAMLAAADGVDGNGKNDGKRTAKFGQTQQWGGSWCH